MQNSPYVIIGPEWVRIHRSRKDRPCQGICAGRVGDVQACRCSGLIRAGQLYVEQVMKVEGELTWLSCSTECALEHGVLAEREPLSAERPRRHNVRLIDQPAGTIAFCVTCMWRLRPRPLDQAFAEAERHVKPHGGSIKHEHGKYVSYPS